MSLYMEAMAVRHCFSTCTAASLLALALVLDSELEARLN